MKVFKMKCGDGLEIDGSRVVFRHFAEVVIHSAASVKVKRIPAEKSNCGKPKRRCGQVSLDKPPSGGSR